MTEPADLFGTTEAAAAAAPLAARLRPRTLDEVVGQRHLLGPGGPLRRVVEGDANVSLILWGPPGTGKTTLAQLVARVSERRFVQLSAVTAGVKDVRAAIEEAKSTLALRGTRTVLFVDEVHRFSKAQQDALLPGVEAGWVTLVAATTENPFFSVISPLLSRSLLVTLQPLDDVDVSALLDRALTDDRGYGGALTLDDAARAHVVRMAGGDARKALTALEAAAAAAQATGRDTIDLETLESAVDRAAVRYDRAGDQHYDVISAFIKSIRGSDVDAGLHWLARMLEAGEDPRFVARRLVILASEDIGLADPTSLQAAVAAAHALELVGLPEAALNLAQAVVHLALAPKSNAVTTALGAATADVRAGRGGPVPPHLRDAHYGGARKLGHGKGYVYPHDVPAGVAAQAYLPDELAGRTYYAPTAHGHEARFGERLERLRAALRGDVPPTDGAAAGDGATTAAAAPRDTAGADARGPAHDEAPIQQTVGDSDQPSKEPS